MGNAKLDVKKRLCFTDAHYAALQDVDESTFQWQLLDNLRKQANYNLRNPQIEVDQTGHNWHLIRARRMQSRLLTAVSAYYFTKDTRFLNGIWRDVQRIDEWEYWSWIAWRSGNNALDATYDLSYGENSLTLAFVYDAMREQWDEKQKKFVQKLAQRRSFGPFFKHIKERDPFWFEDSHTNWNTVCSGGAGLLALALGESCPESEKVLELVEQSVKPFFESTQTDGGWPEGIGYWNFGMRYGFLYLLSSETATGKKHPIFRLPGVKATAQFPLEFSPHGKPCSFGDTNHFLPNSFHLLLARRLKLADVEKELCRRFMAPFEPGVSRADKDMRQLKKLVLQRFDLPLLWQEPPEQESTWKKQKIFPTIGWGYVADSMPLPQVYVSVRGGTLDRPHTHRDLLSFFCVVNGQKMIDNVPVDNYLDSTFGKRREDLYEVSSASKNTVFINGVGAEYNSQAPIESVSGTGFSGFRLDATEAMGSMRGTRTAKFCGRLILLLQNRAVAVIDEFDLTFAGLVESRLHSFGRVLFRTRTADIRQGGESLHVSIASDVETQLQRGLGIATHPPRQPDTMLRHQCRANVHRALLCWLLVPGGQGEAAVESQKDGSLLTFHWQDAVGEATFKLPVKSALNLR